MLGRRLIARLVPLLCPARPLHPSVLPAFRTSYTPHRSTSSSSRTPTPKISRPKASSTAIAMGEFSDDDDDFASFDLDSAVSAAASKRPSVGNPYGGKAPAFRDTNLGVGPSANDDNDDRKQPAGAGGGGGSAAKRLKTDESSLSAALPDDDEGDIPESFKEAMAGTLMSHFGHGTFRPGQLSVLHALLGQGASGGRDACVFWATG